MRRDLLTEKEKNKIRRQPRFHGIHPLEYRLFLQRTQTSKQEAEYVRKAIEKGECGSHGENIEAIEEMVSARIGCKNATALSSGTAAMHLAVKLAAERVYGRTAVGGALRERQVFCSDFTSIDSVNPVLYEGGEPIFIDMSPCDWGMDPEALEIAFSIYPDVKIVIMSHPYGVPGQIPEIREICDRHGALLIEEATDCLGAGILCHPQGGGNTDAKVNKGQPTNATTIYPVGSFGDYSILDFGEDRMISGGAGGMFLTNDDVSGHKARKNSMSNLVAGLIRGQLPYVEEYVAQKKAVYDYYAERFSEDIIYMNPIGEGSVPSYQTSCMTSESAIPFSEIRTDQSYHYESHHGTAAPMEIIEALEAFNIEAGTVYKPMHEQPLLAGCDLITPDGSMKQAMERSSADWYSESSQTFKTGICLPSSMVMTREEQEMVVEIVYACFDGAEIDRMMWA